MAKIPGGTSVGSAVALANILSARQQSPDSVGGQVGRTVGLVLGASVSVAVGGIGEVRGAAWVQAVMSRVSTPANR